MSCEAVRDFSLILSFRHNKGCNCKRSGCLKNYCECYEAKIPCSQYCKCVGCKNLDTETGTKVLCSPLKTGQPKLEGLPLVTANNQIVVGYDTVI